MNDKVSVQGVFEEIQQGSMSSEYASPALSSRDSFVLAWQDKSTKDKQSGFQRIRQRGCTESTAWIGSSPRIIHFRAQSWYKEVLLGNLVALTILRGDTLTLPLSLTVGTYRLCCQEGSFKNQQHEGKNRNNYLLLKTRASILDLILSLPRVESKIPKVELLFQNVSKR